MYKAVEDSELQKIPVVQKRVDLSNQDFIHSLDFFEIVFKITVPWFFFDFSFRCSDVLAARIGA